MQKIVLLIVICFLNLSPSTAQDKPRIYAESALFLNDEEKTVLELQFKVPTQSVQFKDLGEARFQAHLGVFIHITLENDTLNQLTYSLLSEIISNPKASYSLIDVKQFALENLSAIKPKTFKVQLEICDSTSGGCESLTMEIPVKKLLKPTFSSLILLEKYLESAAQTPYSKGNFIPIPRINRLIDINSAVFPVYFEWYANSSWADTEIKLTLLREVDSFNTQAVFSKVVIPKQKSGSIYRLIEEIDPSKLQNGTHHLVATAYVENQLADERFLTFEVVTLNNLAHFGQLYKAAEIEEFIAMMTPILSINEQNMFEKLFKKNELAPIQDAFFEYWQTQDSTKPINLWTNYLAKIQYVNNAYGNETVKGYTTARGYTYLKYGPPADITDYSDNPETYPYEIWEYFDDGKTGGSIFVFASFSFNSKEYRLLHSTALGEIQNPNWKKMLNRAANRDGKPNKRGWGTGWQTEYINE